MTITTIHETQEEAINYAMKNCITHARYNFLNRNYNKDFKKWFNKFEINKYENKIFVTGVFT